MRHDDLVAPALPRHPTIGFQVVGGGGDHVRRGIDDVAPAIAVEINGVALERWGHELRGAEGARPRAHEMLGSDVAALENFQGRKKLFAKIILTPPDAR